jgi:hypothetical protein
VDPDADEAALVERMSWLERVKSAAAAGRARGVALARRDCPPRGGRHLGLAKALVNEMPQVLAALECGALSEWRATLILRESACLDVEDRGTLDAELCADVSRLEGVGDARIVAAAKEIAARLDAQVVVDRAAKAEADRTVTIRAAPDCMTYVIALLPVAQGVGVYASPTVTFEPAPVWISPSLTVLPLPRAAPFPLRMSPSVILVVGLTKLLLLARSVLGAKSG